MSTARTVADAVTDAARSLCGAMLVLREIPAEAVDIRPDEFALQSHSTLWTIGREIQARGDRITPDAVAVVAAQHKVTKQLPDGGRAGWCEDLAAACPSIDPGRLAQQADIVRADARRRDVRRAATEAITRADFGVPVADIVTDLARAVERAQSAPSVAEWPAPQPLVAEIASTPYPVDALPPLFRAAVEEVTAFVQCPLAMVATSALTMASVAVQGLADVERAPGLRGPSTIWTLTIAPSGERKTTEEKLFGEPFRFYETNEAHKAEPVIATFQAGHDAATGWHYA